MSVRGVLVVVDAVGEGPEVGKKDLVSTTFPDAVSAAVGGRPAVLLRSSDTPLGAFQGSFVAVLDTARLGVSAPDGRIVAIAAAIARCHPHEVAVITSVAASPSVVVAAHSVGARVVVVDPSSAMPADAVAVDVDAPDAVVGSYGGVAAALDEFDAADHRASGAHGLGPHPLPWPDDQRLDPELLASGDRRNVIDAYRYWREAEIVADLQRRAHSFEVAIENWRHDRNIGTVVRNANAFGAAAVHIIGRRKWNRRGAMATDRYLDVRQHATNEDFLADLDARGLPLVAIDNVAGAQPIERVDLPETCVLVFGQEGPGLSADLLERAAVTCEIGQHGSTRSLNAGVASGIAMYQWVRQHGRDVRPAPRLTVRSDDEPGRSPDGG